MGGVCYLIHYLDDFFCANSSIEVCHDDMDKIVSLCAKLKVPLAPDKVVGPTQCLTFLGIEIDTVEMVIRLPSEKLTKIRKILASASYVIL